MIRQFIALLLAINVHCKMHECPHEWIFIEGKCYFFEKTKASFNEAASLCSAKGGKLFEPRNKKIDEMVSTNHHIQANLHGDEHVWIGLHRTGQGYSPLKSKVLTPRSILSRCLIKGQNY